MYEITITKITEYPEKETVYESTVGGTRYYSKYHTDITNGGVKVVEKEYDTGKMLQRKDTVYTQTFEAADLKSVIKAVNQL